MKKQKTVYWYLNKGISPINLHVMNTTGSLLGTVKEVYIEPDIEGFSQRLVVRHF
jgi:sporulation protein YlmC with PRC-barrel domain